MKRLSGGGIDWYQYCEEVLCSKLLPFFVEMDRERPETTIVQDGAGPHIKHWIEPIFAEYRATCKDWCGNSPDFNTIEHI